MAGYIYWPSSFLKCLWTKMDSRSINTYKDENEANIQQSLPHKLGQQRIYYITQRLSHIINWKTDKSLLTIQCSNGTINFWYKFLTMEIRCFGLFLLFSQLTKLLGELSRIFSQNKIWLFLLYSGAPYSYRARMHWANFCLFCEKICHQFPETSASGDF